MEVPFSQSGHAARVNHLRDEELYLLSLKDHIPQAVIAMLERRLELIKDEKKKVTDALSIIREDTRLPSFACQYSFDGDGRENLTKELVAFLDTNIRYSSVQVSFLRS